MRESIFCTIAVLAVSGCGGSDSTGPAATTAVSVRDNSFSPGAITVSPQATVTWTWNGSDTHNVTFEDAQGSSGTQVSGTHNRSFATTGTFRHRCTVHSESFTSGMIGSVLVQ